MSSKRYVAVYQRDPDSDAWLVHIQGEPACQTYGRSLRQAGARIREALGVWLDRELDTLLVTDRLPADLEALTRRVAHRRTQAERAVVEAQAATAHAVRELAARGLSRRDARIFSRSASPTWPDQAPRQRCRSRLRC